MFLGVKEIGRLQVGIALFVVRINRIDVGSEFYALGRCKVFGFGFHYQVILPEIAGNGSDHEVLYLKLDL
jgi:hypothetical protein